MVKSTFLYFNLEEKQKYLHDFIQEGRFDFQIFKAANVSRRLDRFLKIHEGNNNKRNKYEQSPSVQQQKLKADLWVQVSEDVHPGFLHHGKQVRVVVGPPHVPNILAFKLGWISCRRLAPPGLVRGGPSLQVQQRHHSCDVDDGQTTKEHNVYAPICSARGPNAPSNVKIQRSPRVAVEGQVVRSVV